MDFIKNDMNNVKRRISMNVQEAKKIAEKKYPNMVITSGLEMEDLFVFARHPKGEPTFADSCAITVNRKTGECKTQNFREYTIAEVINVYEY